MEYYFERYGDLELQRRMIADRWRTDAFARAIAQEVREGDFVLDVGTGTGILAMLCGRAGARKVLGVDQAEITQTAANLVKANGLQDTVSILRGAAQELDLDESVDLIVSEWLGNFAFVEGMLEDVLAVRDKHLAPGGRMLPSHVEVLLAPIDDSVLYVTDGAGYWRRPVHGLDYSGLEQLELQQGRVPQLRIDPGSLLAEGISLVKLDLATATAKSPWCEGSLSFTVSRDAVLNGFAGWFVAQLAPGVRLDTSPAEPETHWAQSYFPFEPRVVREGEVIEVAFALKREPTEHRYVRLELDVAGRQIAYRLE